MLVLSVSVDGEGIRVLKYTGVKVYGCKGRLYRFKSVSVKV